MTLPSKAPDLTVALHGHGREGMYVYRYDSKAYDVSLEIRCERRGQAETQTWRFAWLPYRGFATYAALRDAVNAMSAQTIESERKAWPMVSKTRPAIKGNRCRLCADRPPATVSVTLLRSWIDVTPVSLCDEHTPMATDPAALAMRDQAAIDDTRAGIARYLMARLPARG